MMFISKRMCGRVYFVARQKSGNIKKIVSNYDGVCLTAVSISIFPRFG